LFEKDSKENEVKQRRNQSQKENVGKNLGKVLGFWFSQFFWVESVSSD
jgi:hypothetical protein